MEIKDGEEWVQEGIEVSAHYSSLSLHRKCPQAWYYRYDLGLTRDIAVISAPERDFGSWWGALLSAESIERGRRLDSLKYTRSFRSVDGIDKFDGKTITVEEVMAAAADWWEKQPFEAKEDWHARLGEDLVSRLTKNYEMWFEITQKDRQYQRPIGNEVFWERKLPKPEADKKWDPQAHGLELRLYGFVDHVYEDTQRGMIVVEDRKTAKQLSSQSAIDDMMDSQLQFYGWGLTPLLKEWGLPPARAVSYDRIRSVKPTTPSLTAGGSLSKTVTMFDERTYRDWAAEDTRPDEETRRAQMTGWSQEQRDYVESLPPGRVYGSWGEWFVTGAKKGLPKFGVYQIEDSVLERVTTPAHRSAFIQRTLVPISPHVQRAHLRAAVDTATDVWRTQQRAERAGEATRNFTGSNCRFCDYSTLCRAQMFGGPLGEYNVSEHGLRQRDGLKIIGVS